ncbi:MAG: ABC transporter ATP-binding protein [Actinomycetaceae bacterium]|nr:ABC transporter ATP-binding protein [Actinomycetaceae bacterium]
MSTTNPVSFGSGDDIAVQVEDVAKVFRVYKERNQSIKGSLLRRGRAHFEEFHALRDINLQIPQGKTFGLLGHNGSGKSTLLKCIAKILTPDTGKITSRGRIAAMLEVGSGFHPELSGRENVYLNGAILGMSKAEIDKKFDQIVDFSGVEHFIDQPVKNYSSGMYVRLGFAVSIHVEPDILLVDEVLAVGDMEFQEKCMDKFAQFKEEGRTVIVVSHGLEQMRTFCDEAAWLEHGVLKDVGPAAQIVDAYSDVVRGAVSVQGGGTRFGTGEAIITGLEWLDDQGRQSLKNFTGENVRIKLSYEAKARIEAPVFGVSVDTREGYWVWGLHGHDANFVPEAIEPGPGSLEIVIPHLPLRPASYTLSASIQNKDMTKVIDAWQKALRFEVLPGPGMESGGVVVFGAHFENLKPERPMIDIPQRTRSQWEELAVRQVDEEDKAAELEEAARLVEALEARDAATGEAMQG